MGQPGGDQHGEPAGLVDPTQPTDAPAAPDVPAVPAAADVQSVPTVPGWPEDPWAPVGAAAAEPAPQQWPPTRGETRAVAIIIGVLAVVGVLLAVVWWQIAPRLAFRVTADGPVPVTVEQEEFFAVDGWFILLTLPVGVLAPFLLWRFRSVRGPFALIGLAVGGIAGTVLTWRLGLLLGPTPTAADLKQVGATVYPALRLHATVALVIEPIVAVAAYLLRVGFASRPDLGRPDPGAAPYPGLAPPPYWPLHGEAPWPALPGPSAPADQPSRNGSAETVRDPEVGDGGRQGA
jgi:hypothetical protein